MKDLGEAKVILGLEIRRDKALGTLKLSQGKYAAQVLEKFGMAECNPIGTPLEVGLQLVKADGSDDVLPYREAVGSLMYLMVGTRPDLAFAIGKLSRFVSCYGKEHWAAIKRVLRYVKGSVNKGLAFDKNSSCVLQGCSDADWAGDHETRRSTTGFTFIFGGAAVSWGSKLQKTVALSTMEAQYMALLLKRSGDRGWGTTVKWLSGLSLCVCVRTCFVGCPKVRPPLPTESTSQIVPTGPSAPPSRAHTDAHALAPNRITQQIKSH